MASKSRGRRTGVTVADDVAKSSATDRMEDAAALFDSAVSPPKRNESIAAAAKPRKPKEQVRFSLAKEIADSEDTFAYNSLNQNHPSRRLAKLAVNVNAAGRQQRASVDTNDLSSVSTAVLSVPEDPEEEAQLADDPDLDAEDELIPPPPDDESSDSNSEEEGNEPHEMVATQREQEEVDFPAPDDNPGDEDFPDADDNPDDMNEFPAAERQEEYDDADNDGVGYRIPDQNLDDNEDSEENDDPETPEAVREQRRRKAKRAEKLAAVKSKKRKGNGKVKAGESSDNSDDDTEVTPAVKQPARKKKKLTVNPYATTFESKGQPLPQTFTEIPISNLVQTPPADQNLRRSKRARTKPLEYWRGEKYEWGANDFDQDDDYAFEGVTNMPVPVKVVQADPTPYKKRKVSSSVPKKKKGGKKSDEVSDVAAQDTFDASRLPYPINEGKVAQIWDERYNDTRGLSKFLLCCLLMSSSCSPLRVLIQAHF